MQGRKEKEKKKEIGRERVKEKEGIQKVWDETT